jgi:hypothetical protein
MMCSRGSHASWIASSGSSRHGALLWMWSRDAAEPRLKAQVPKTPLFLRPKNDSPQPSIPDNPLSGRLLYRRDPLQFAG